MDREDSRARGRECGVSAYMTKPFDPETLIAAIRDHASCKCEALAPVME
jgi:DNA-binding response OmpR family regulator